MASLRYPPVHVTLELLVERRADQAILCATPDIVVANGGQHLFLDLIEHELVIDVHRPDEITRP